MPVVIPVVMPRQILLRSGHIFFDAEVSSIVPIQAFFDMPNVKGAVHFIASPWFFLVKHRPDDYGDSIATVRGRGAIVISHLILEKM